MSPTYSLLLLTVLVPLVTVPTTAVLPRVTLHDTKVLRKYSLEKLWTKADQIRTYWGLNELPPIPVPTRDYTDIEQYGTIKVGGQEVRVNFDTGSPDFWIISSECPNANHQKYDHSKSTDHQWNNTRFENGQVTGAVGSDMVEVAEWKSRLTFAEATKVSEYLVTDGSMGLTRDSAALSGFDGRVFSLYHHSHAGKTLPSELIMGLDVSKYSNRWKYMALEDSRYWLINITHISGDNAHVCVHGCQGIIDTGSNLISGPSEDIQKLNVDLGAVKQHDGVWTIDCAKVDPEKSVYFYYGPSEIRVSVENYIVREMIGSEMICYTVFVELDLAGPRGAVWILGDVALRSHSYVFFDVDNNRIGIDYSRFSET